MSIMGETGVIGNLVGEDGGSGVMGRVVGSSEGGTPEGALVDRDGTPILDRDGNYIIVGHG